MQEAHVAIKPPQFFRNSPETWFTQIESQFILANITKSETKYHHLISFLPEDIACEVISPTVKTYEDLKSAVINYLKANKHQLIETALSAIELGDKRPSQLVNAVKKRFAEIGLKADDAIIKSRLLTALPFHIRTALVGHEAAALEQYAKISDSMMAINQTSSTFVPCNQIGTKFPAEQPHFRKKTYLPKLFYEGQRPVICNAHVYFGNKAKTCRHWCRWPGKKPRMINSREMTPRNSCNPSPTNF